MIATHLVLFFFNVNVGPPPTVTVDFVQVDEASEVLGQSDGYGERLTVSG